jgi:hypothetical protein
MDLMIIVEYNSAVKNPLKFVQCVQICIIMMEPEDWESTLVYHVFSALNNNSTQLR